MLFYSNNSNSFVPASCRMRFAFMWFTASILTPHTPVASCDRPTPPPGRRPHHINHLPRPRPPSPLKRHQTKQQRRKERRERNAKRKEKKEKRVQDRSRGLFSGSGTSSSSECSSSSDEERQVKPWWASHLPVLSVGHRTLMEPDRGIRPVLCSDTFAPFLFSFLFVGVQTWPMLAFSRYENPAEPRGYGHRSQSFFRLQTGMERNTLLTKLHATHPQPTPCGPVRSMLELLIMSGDVPSRRQAKITRKKKREEDKLAKKQQQQHGGAHEEGHKPGHVRFLA